MNNGIFRLLNDEDFNENIFVDWLFCGRFFK